MLIDVLNLITPDQHVLGNNYLSGSTPNITYVSALDANYLQQLVYMKGLSGYPWDWLTVGQDYIYQRLTENVWGDPTTGKLVFGLGQPRFPRYIDYSPEQPAGSWSFTIGRPTTDYIIFGPGAVPTSRNTDNNVRCTFRGPYPGAAIGDLPAGVDWFGDYEWGGSLVGGVMQYTVKEVVAHRVGYGRYAWQSFNAVGGVYGTTPAQQSSTTFIKPLTGAVIPVQKIF